MENNELFIYATKKGLRFPYKGLITVEDLWQLNVTNLDTIYKTLNSEIKKISEESLLSTPTKENTELSVKIDIIKYIVADKQAEANARLEAVEKKQKKQKLMALLEKKQNEALEGMSEEDIKKELAELE